jgi:hypothetical protein
MAIKKTTKQVKPQTPIRVNNTVFIRTVTLYYTGIITQVSKEEIVLKDAAWIASTGRWANALKTGTLEEVEPYPDGSLVSVNRGAVIDVCDWGHPAPRTVQ